MDYQLGKLYEGMRKGTAMELQRQSLTDLYEAVKKAEKKAEKKARKEKEPAVAVGPVTVSGSEYDSVIANALFGKPAAVDRIPVPRGTYLVGQQTQVDDADMETYRKLYPVTPPKAGQTVAETSVGTKGSGNGEIALYWLLNKKYDITDNRSASKPDLAVTYESMTYGIEVKAYEEKRITLGRFGDQHKNRGILSIVFGLRALLNVLDPDKAVRVPSLDTFNKQELINSFELLKSFDDNKQLRSIAHKFTPIAMIYQQIDVVLRNLDLRSGEFTATEGAAAVVAALLKTKLKIKPGYTSSESPNMGNGYLASVSESGRIKYHQVSERNIDDLDANIILDNVNANGAALLITPDVLFRDTPEVLY